ncbi:hypothetical protein LOC68_18905 [Blastopirellula sp. JC732]|uniref:Uncharacterized protein n=1 Tax=Blastopirellula sediminis TaxID=2894196 RepID=A0A9X1MQF7_9BACT|nr:hypothetical protein [Blastopirellula sediminis]MCC9606232.1 hypothetical protein [Blastopirellula sediminis]MCC9630470.1 hypothetical protein [Blastopirellula sediminis]
MPDFELENLCCDLVSERRYEPFLIQLLRTDAGHWQRVLDLAQRSGIDLSQFRDLMMELSVVWLNHPTGDPSYVAILFYDFDSKWTKGADYNFVRVQQQLHDPDEKADK